MTTPLAIALLYPFGATLDAPRWLSTTVLLGVGVVLPQLLADYLDGRDGEEAARAPPGAAGRRATRPRDAGDAG